MFGTQNVCICFRVVHERKEKTTGLKFLGLISLTLRRVNGTQGVYFTLEKLRVLLYKQFASLWCGYLGAAPVFYVQDVTNTIVILDN